MRNWTGRLAVTVWTEEPVERSGVPDAHGQTEERGEERDAVLCCCSGESHQDGTSARTRRRRWVFWLKVPAALLHRPPCADGSGRRAGTPVPTVPGQRRRVGRAASVAGPAKDWFLTALLDLIVPQHDHAVGRRATDTVRARSALGSDGR